MSTTNDPYLNQLRAVYPYTVSLTDCDAEPLHHIQVVQSYACLIAVRLEDMVVHYVSENAEDRIGVSWQQIVGQPLKRVLNEEITSQISLGLNRANGFETLNPLVGHFKVGGSSVTKNIVVHRSGEYLILDIESAETNFHSSGFQARLGSAIQAIQGQTTLKDLFSESVRIVRRLTGYDRVMLYRFDAEYNGEVIAEAHREGIDPFLGLRYPHTDIPKQARELYLRNQVRLVSNTKELPARLMKSKEAGADELLDLSLSNVRGVSPIHLEYLYNMGVNATMSIAIVLDGKLWGLFAMHHYQPRVVDYNLRSFLRFLGQIFSGHLALQSGIAFREQMLRRNMIQSALGEQVDAHGDVIEGLTSARLNLQGIIPNSGGAAVYFEGEYQAVGNCPDEETASELIDWIKETTDGEMFFSADDLCRRAPGGEKLSGIAAGALVVFLNPDRTDWLGWFRPEVSRTVRWGGRPEKLRLTSDDGSVRIAPRRSFAEYLEKVAGHSEPWNDTEVDAAIVLRQKIIDSILRRFVSIRETNEELKSAYSEMEAFSYTVSHDLRAPLRAIHGFSEILAEEYHDKLDEEGRFFIKQIQENTEQMDHLINGVLELTRVGRTEVADQIVDVAELLQYLLRVLNPKPLRAAGINLQVAENLSPVNGDDRLLRQLFTNLLTNACKYGHSPQEEGELHISVGMTTHQPSGNPGYFFANTGPVIEERYHESIFDIFPRLSNVHEAEGTGVGLAIVQRIVQLHGGDIYIDPEYKDGVKFVFTLS